MKRFRFLVLFALLATIFFSCDRTNEVVEPDDRVVFSGEVFQTTYRLPLKEGNVFSGEADIVDNALIENENVRLVKPTLNMILEDLKSGKLNAYPTDDMTTEIAPNEYFNHVWKSIEKGEAKMSFEHLTQCVEVIFDGKTTANSSTLEPAWLRLVWVDVDRIFPDKNFVQVKMEDLSGYNLPLDQQVALPSYLAKRNYEYYTINLRVDDRWMGIRTHPDAVAIQDLIESGKVEEAINFYVQ